MKKRRIHLVCNAHLDPVWLWEWEEGAAEALSTFRVAADFCERYDDFVFCHNEAILYRWVEEYEPALFERIGKLVKAGKWHVMGGWWLQPDCNMPSGESFIRQILVGKTYFKDRFGVEPRTAINFDPFGHTRGLAQILAKSGYDAYLFCRPQTPFFRTRADQFLWEGFDGSRVMAHRVQEYYCTPAGAARGKVERVIESHADRPVDVVLWGVGNHGGGASRVDLEALAKLIRAREDVEIFHSTPDAYFAELGKRAELHVHTQDINPFAVGCYTSIIRIKQKHRRLENALYMAEKMAVAAWTQGSMDYPREELAAATEDLLTAEFHDVLPGSCIQAAEESALRLLDHGLEILSRVQTRAFFALAAGQRKGKPEAMPVLAYNPHPYPLPTVVECEFQMPGQNWTGSWIDYTATVDGKAVPCQVEQEASNIATDWRKRVAVAVTLPPGRMTRIDCYPVHLKRRPRVKLRAREGRIRFKTGELEVIVNTRTGLVDRYRARGIDLVDKGAFQPQAVADDCDAWGMCKGGYGKVIGRFRPPPKAEAARLSGLDDASQPAVRVIEDGPVRVIVEAVLSWGHSAVIQRYKLPRRGTRIEVETRVYWNEKDTLLKLAVPVPGAVDAFLGQTACGVQPLPGNGEEAVAQKWTALVYDDGKHALTWINDGVYGCDLRGRTVRASLVRSPAYSGHPIMDLPVVPPDRFTARIDQGERLFRFWFDGGEAKAQLDAVDRAALALNEKPFVVSFFPSGQGRRPKPLAEISDKVVQIQALKKAQKGDDLIVRLFEPTGRKRTTTLSLPCIGLKRKVSLGAFEIKTLRVNPKTRALVETELLERKPRSKARARKKR